MDKKTDTFSYKDLRRLFLGLAAILFLLLLPKIYNLSVSSISSFWQNLIFFDFSNYPYSNPPIFFSIGEALAAIAILLAVYQFRKEKWEIALEVRASIRPVIVSLIVLGFVAVAFSSVISFFKPHNIFLLSVFWQIIASILIIFAIGFLFLRASNKNLLNAKTKDRFIGSLLRRVSSRSPDQIDMAVNAIAANFNTILREVTVPQRRSDEVPEFTKSAHFVLTQIISNPNFAQHVVTARADFLQRFLRTISDRHLYGNNDITVAFNAFVRTLFINRDSYFYSELKHSDPGVYYKPFLEDVFSDQEMFLRFRPLDQIGFEYGEAIEENKLALFIAAFETAIEGYFSEPRSVDFEYSHYRWAFEKIEHALSRVVDELNNSGSKNNWHITNKLHQITFFVGWRFQNLYREAVKNNKVSQRDLEAPIEEKSYGTYPHSLTSGYAELLFKLLCILNECQDKEMIRHYAMTLTDHILIFNEPQFENIRKVLLRFIWDKISDGRLSNIDGFYPLILPIFLSLIGMYQDGASPERKALYNQIVEFLNNKLKPKILAGTKMANDDLMEERLLPPSVFFNREKGLFEYKMHRGTQEMVVR